MIPEKFKKQTRKYKFGKKRGKAVCLYMRYPTPERIQCLRNRIDAWNLIDEMVENRLRPLAKAADIAKYIYGDADIREKLDKEWGEVERRQKKFHEDTLATVKFYIQELKEQKRNENVNH